jgi:hypothetical protein
VQVAVVENAAAWRYFKSPKLLLLSALDKLLVPHNLEPEKPAANGQRPKKKEQADQPETRPLERNNARRAGAASTGSNVELHRELLRGPWKLLALGYRLPFT